MSETAFDGRMIGLQGQVVTYPQWFFAVLLNSHRRLIRIAREKHRQPIRILERDKPTGFWRVLPAAKAQLGDLLELPNCNPRQTLHALNPGFNSGRPRRCGRRGLIDLLEAGIDTTRREMRECEADLQESRLSQMRVHLIIQELESRRGPIHRGFTG